MNGDVPTLIPEGMLQGRVDRYWKERSVEDAFVYGSLRIVQRRFFVTVGQAWNEVLSTIRHLPHGHPIMASIPSPYAAWYRYAAFVQRPFTQSLQPLVRRCLLINLRHAEVGRLRCLLADLFFAGACADNKYRCNEA